MPRKPSPLPAQLRGRPFAVAQHPEITEARARASDLWAPTRGVRLPADSRDLISLCMAHAITAPLGAAFSHTTAALIHGAPLPRWAESDGIHLTVPVGTRAPRRRGTIGHQRALSPHEVVTHRGVSVTSPARTLCDLAEILDLVSLVAVGDYLIARRRPLADTAALRAACERRRGERGAKRLLAAIELLDPGAESPKESELRLVLISAGFGPLAANHEIRDAQGRFIARTDLAIVALRIVIEYEGDHHRDRIQWRRDMARRRRIEAEGWFYLSVTQADLDDPRELLADLAATIAVRS